MDRVDVGVLRVRRLREVEKALAVTRWCSSCMANVVREVQAQEAHGVCEVSEVAMGVEELMR